MHAKIIEKANTIKIKTAFAHPDGTRGIALDVGPESVGNIWACFEAFKVAPDLIEYEGIRYVKCGRDSDRGEIYYTTAAWAFSGFATVIQ